MTEAERQFAAIVFLMVFVGLALGLNVLISEAVAGGRRNDNRGG